MSESPDITKKGALATNEREVTPESIGERTGARVIQIETEKMTLRGTLSNDPSDPDIRRIKVGYPIDLAGREIEIKKSSLNLRQAFEFREKNADWQRSSTLQAIATWEASAFTSFDEFERRSLFPNSKDLPSNPYTGREPSAEIDAKYTDLLNSYEWSPPAPTDAQEQKTAFAFEHGLGWKAHINSTPENVIAVSEYLKAHAYEHKFLSGGDSSDGKVFTVYFGSKQKLDQWASIISQDLKVHLAAPGALDEMEAAPGIAARFDPGIKRNNDFFRYGFCGLPVMRGDTPEQSTQFRHALTKGTREEKVEAARTSYARLQEMYGSYFTG